MLTTLIGRADHNKRELERIYGFEIDIHEPSYENWSDSAKDEEAGLGSLLCSYEDSIDSIVQHVGNVQLTYNDMCGREMFTCFFVCDDVEYSIAWFEGNLKNMRKL